MTQTFRAKNNMCHSTKRTPGFELLVLCQTDVLAVHVILLDEEFGNGETNVARVPMSTEFNHAFIRIFEENRLAETSHRDLCSVIIDKVLVDPPSGLLTVFGCTKTGVAAAYDPVDEDVVEGIDFPSFFKTIMHFEKM